MPNRIQSLPPSHHPGFVSNRSITGFGNRPTGSTPTPRETAKPLAGESALAYGQPASATGIIEKTYDHYKSQGSLLMGLMFAAIAYATASLSTDSQSTKVGAGCAGFFAGAMGVDQLGDFIKSLIAGPGGTSEPASKETAS
jgi:hypothetical protein